MITMGGWDLDKFAKEGLTDDDIKWMDLAEDSWTLGINGMRFKGDESNLMTKVSQISLDTGLSYIMAPSDDINRIAAALKKQNIKC